MFLYFLVLLNNNYPLFGASCRLLFHLFLGRLSTNQACRFYQQLISSIEYLSSLNIVHRDLKPENMLLDQNLNIKVVDFGLSNTYKKGEQLKTACGSPCYAAPEMVLGHLYTPSAVDIWSSAIILYAMLTGALPFEDANNSVLYKKIINLNYYIPSDLPDSARTVLQNTITLAEKRYDLAKIKQSEFFNLVQYKKPTGLFVGSEWISIDKSVLSEICRQFALDPDTVRGSVENNKHNSSSTTYYLTLQKKRREGYKSRYDINSPLFEQSGVVHQTRDLSPRYQKQATNVSVGNIRVETPINSQAAKEDQSNLGNQTIEEGEYYTPRGRNLKRPDFKIKIQSTSQKKERSLNPSGNTDLYSPQGTVSPRYRDYSSPKSNNGPKIYAPRPILNLSAIVDESRMHNELGNMHDLQMSLKLSISGVRRQSPNSKGNKGYTTFRSRFRRQPV